MVGHIRLLSFSFLWFCKHETYFYIRGSSIDKDSGVRHWGDNLTDQRSSGGATSRPLHTFQPRMEGREAHESPSPSILLPVPFYPYPESSMFSMTNSCQLVADSTLGFRVNVISTAWGVSERDQISHNKNLQETVTTLDRGIWGNLNLYSWTMVPDIWLQNKLLFSLR